MTNQFTTWDSEQVGLWVETLGPQFKALSAEFQKAGVTGKFMPSISVSDLKDMGLDSDYLQEVFRKNVNALITPMTSEKSRRTTKRHPVTPGESNRGDRPRRVVYRRRNQDRRPIIPATRHPQRQRSPARSTTSTKSSRSATASTKSSRSAKSATKPPRNPQSPRKGPQKASSPRQGRSSIRSQDKNARSPRRKTPPRPGRMHPAIRQPPEKRVRRNPDFVHPPCTQSLPRTARSPRQNPVPSYYSASPFNGKRKRDRPVNQRLRTGRNPDPGAKNPNHGLGRRPTFTFTQNTFPRQPVISSQRTTSNRQIREPYAVSLKATVVNHPRKQNKKAKITIIENRRVLQQKDGLPDTWFGQRHKKLSNSNQSLISLSSNPSNSFESGASSVQESGSSSVQTSNSASMENLTDNDTDTASIGGDDIREIEQNIRREGQKRGPDPPPRLSLALRDKPPIPHTLIQSEINPFCNSTVNEWELNSVFVELPRPKNADQAFLEFSNAIAICVCSLQLGHDYLELLYQLSDRLYGREQVNYDLSQSSVTRSLASNYECLQLLNLLGFDLEGEMLVCRNKPHEQVLRVFQKYIREYQYAGFATYDTTPYQDVLDNDSLKMFQIVMAVTHDNAQTNEDLMRSFVVFLPYLCEVQTMIELLHFWYEQCKTHFENPTNVQASIATLVKLLLEHFKLEVLASPKYEELLLNIQKNDPVGFNHIQAVIRESNSSVRTLPFLLQNTISTVRELLDLPPTVLADNLTLSNFNLFSSIPMLEFFEQNRTTSKLAEFFTRYENIQRWVMITIYRAVTVDDRVARVRLFFKVAERMLENQDIFGFYAIFRALETPEIQSFDSTWSNVFIKKFRSRRDYEQLWQSWQNVCTKKGKGTEMFWKLRAPGIPHVHVISAHMEWIASYQEVSRDSVELFCQLRKLYPFVKKLSNLQKAYFSLQADISAINALEAEFLSQSKLNLWSVRSLYIQALNADSLPIPPDVLTKMNRPNSARSPR